MKIVIIAGSNRKGSTSTRLAEYMERLIRQKGHQVQLFDLYQTPLPFYSPDESYTGHEQVTELKQLMLASDGIILATPEYHGSISGVLKNALDHLSQDHFSGKPVLSVSTAGGPVGVSSLQAMQAVVRNLHGINSPDWISVGGAQRQSFSDDLDSYEGGQGIRDRVHRVLGSFMQLILLIRG